MSIGAIALAAMLLQQAALAPPSESAEAATPIGAFLMAADRGDVAAMKAAMAPKSLCFIAKIDGCYLRRVYRNNASGELIAGWMCADGAQKSRVVLANISTDKNQKVVVSSVSESRNNVPAPARSGSAF